MIFLRTHRAIFAPQKLLPALVLILVSLVLSAESVAQSCSQANNTIRNIERNRDFRNLNSNTQIARDLSRDLGTVERAFVNAGCQRALNNGQSLSRQCRTAARQITRGRQDLNTLEGRIRSGEALSRQRAQLIQTLNNGNCGSSATVNRNERPKNFFEQLFDALSGDGSSIIQEEFPIQNYHTLRSVCVRKSDGYYWPVSYATVASYLQNDALQCSLQCPGADVDLYYYSNPGQEPKDMVNLAGEAYAALPNAFLYRNEYNIANSCKTQVEAGKIEVVEVRGISRTILVLDELNLPLPLRDPRRQVETVIAEVVHIPLPRPRPRPPGSESAGPTQILSAELRIVEVNGRVVRIVGPDTPYVLSVATGI